MKNRLSELVERLQRQHGRVVITKRGRPAAVVMSVEDLESLEETLSILSDARLLADVREAREDEAAGRTTPSTRDEAAALIRRR